jgi:hypothetical protein
VRDNLDCDFPLECIDALLNVLLRGRIEAARYIIESNRLGCLSSPATKRRSATKTEPTGLSKTPT